MFGFLKRNRELSEARTKIGVDLHRQVRDAFRANERRATEHLSTSFSVGYISGFVHFAFMSLGVDIGKTLEDQVQHVCEGVIPGKLHKIYLDQRAVLEIAKQMTDQDKKILNTDLSPSEVTRMFNLGVKAANYDASLVSLEATPPDNLRRFLLGESLRC